MWIDPVIVTIGPLEIRWYGIAYVVGMLLVYYFLKKKRETLSLDMRSIDDLLLYLMIGMIIGARIVHFAVNDPKIFILRPWELIMVWHGGMSFFGGLFGAITGTWLFCRKRDVSFWTLGDVIVIPAALALALGRLANFINDELVGTVTDVAWCIVFPGYAGCRHPYQLYAAATHFLMFGILVFISKKRHWKGMVFAWFLVLYGAFRFLTDFFRDDPRLIWLTVWQFLSIGITFVGIYLIRNRLRRP